ncbi:hypothetical protein HDZ31DRAFT_60455 [Schizophyllum fasciatum]
MSGSLDMDADFDKQSSPSASGSSAAYDTIAPGGSGTQHLPQVRARITVVCAECKRLKLKCDRKMPCGSCVKREATAKCQYSAAAAEKVDLQSLNNRLIQLEQFLSMSSGGQFSSTYPLAQVIGGMSYTSPPCSHGPATAPSPAGAHPALSQLLQASVEPVALTLPTRALWTDWSWPTDIADTVQLPPMAEAHHKSTGATSDLSYDIRKETNSSPSSAASFIKQGDIGSGRLRAPVILVDAVPVAELLEALPAIFAKMRSFFPGFFRCEYGHERVAEHLARSDEKRTAAKQKAKAQQIFFGNNPRPPAIKPPGFAPNDPLFSSFSVTGNDGQTKKKSPLEDEWSLSFYAVACALRALAPAPNSRGNDEDHWYSQSTQACQAWDQYCGTPSAKEGSNYVTALLAHIAYCLTRADIAGASNAIHKVVIFFRNHHLTVGPKDESALKAVKDGREQWMNDVWLDIIFWDVFVSDKMGQPPLISEGCVPAMEHINSDAPDLLVQRFRLASIVRLTKTRYWTLDALEAELTQFATSLAENSLESLMPTPIPNASAGAKRKRARPIPDALGEPEQRENEIHIQKLDLVLAAWQTLFAVYIPALKRDHYPANPKWGGIINVAHRVVGATIGLFSYTAVAGNSKHRAPIAVGGSSATSCNFAPLAALYPLHGTLFSAALVCGYGAVKQPSSVWAAGASEGARDARGAFMSPAILKLGDAVGETLGQREALQILDAILSKLQGASSGGRKRKHDEIAGVDAPPSAAGLSREYQPPSTPLAERLARMGETAKEKAGDRPEKKKKRDAYPPIGVRVRYGSASRSTDAVEMAASQSALTFSLDPPFDGAVAQAQSSTDLAEAYEQQQQQHQHQPEMATSPPAMSAYLGERPMSAASMAFDARAVDNAAQFDPYGQQQRSMGSTATIQSSFDSMRVDNAQAGRPGFVAHPDAHADISHGRSSRRPSLSYSTGVYEAQHRATYEPTRTSYDSRPPPASPYESIAGPPMGSTASSPYASGSGSADGGSGLRSSGSSSSAMQMAPSQSLAPAHPSSYGQPAPPVPPQQLQQHTYYDGPRPQPAYQYATAQMDPSAYYAPADYGTYDVKPSVTMLDAQARVEAYNAPQYAQPPAESRAPYGDRGWPPPPPQYAQAPPQQQAPQQQQQQPVQCWRAGYPYGG